MRIVAVIVAVGLAAGIIWFDQGSLERGNRLYRDGDPPAAVEVYERVPSAEYNLGTALLGIDADSSEVLLRLATESEDGVTAQRGYYNLGYRLLALSQGPMGRDSAISVLGQAVVSNRAALRIDPNDQDARWNLALAQRGFDGLVIPPNEAARESGSDNDDEIASAAMRESTGPGSSLSISRDSIIGACAEGTSKQWDTAWVSMASMPPHGLIMAPPLLKYLS